MTQLVKINAADYGLEESKAKEISELFKPMLDKMVELEKEYNGIVKNEISKELCSEAKELRLKYVKVRTGTDEIHKKLKAFYLQGGRFVDGWKNAQLMASSGIENKLMSIEKHYERIEQERIEKLHGERVLILEKYEVDFIPGDLGGMESEVWENYISGVKLNYQAKIEAEKKAEQDRIQQEKENALSAKRFTETSPISDFIPDWDKADFRKMDQADYDTLLSDAKKRKLEYQQKQEQIRKDNVRLQQEAEERETKRIEAEKKQQEQAEKERLQHEAELKRVRDENDRIAKQLEAKRIEAEKTESERLALIESEKSKDDSAKVHDLIDELNSVKVKFEFKSAKNKKMYSDVGLLIDKIITHIRQ